jgi:hypothetical protein
LEVSDYPDRKISRTIIKCRPFDNVRKQLVSL